MSHLRRASLAPLPLLLLATAVGSALGAVVALDVGPPPSIGSALPVPDPVPSWGGPWSERAVTPASEQEAGLERLSALVGLVGSAAVLAALGAAATLLGTGGAARGREVAVRAALGAGPWRLRAGLLRDHALLLGLGLAGGALLGLGGGLAARRAWPADTPPLPDTGPLLLVTAVAGTLALLMALAPARSARPARLPALLAGARSTADAGETGLRRALLVLQVAAAVAVPVPALLLLAPSAEGEGTAPPDVVMAGVASAAGDWAPLLARLRDDPALVSESIASPGAWEGLGPTDLVLAECRCTRGMIWVPFLGARARHHAVSAGFLDSAGVGVLEGRGLSPSDDGSAERVAVVSVTFARDNFEGSAIGRWIRVGRAREGFHRVVGVVEDRAVPGLATGGGPEVYLSILQHPVTAAVAAASPRPGLDAEAAAPALIAAARTSGAAVGEPASGAERAAARTAPLRALGAAALMLAALAVLSALAGVHALSRLDVTLRRRELAVRRALGASGGVLARWLVARRIRDLAWGGGVGLWGAVSVAALLREAAVLPGSVRAAPFATTLAAVALVALAGTARGARDASRVEPAAALGGEEGGR